MEGLLLQNLTAGYADYTVFKNLSLTVAPKTILVLMGTSGSGKTTLLKTILGIITPQTGTISCARKDLIKLPIEQRNIGYLSQNYSLFPHLTVGENIAYGLRIRGVPRDEQRAQVKNMLELIDLKGYENKAVAELSGGQQQRVGLARALAIKPDLFLLDEPLSNIDQATKFTVAQDMKKLFDTLNIPIILVTHQYEDALFFDAQIAIMIKGVIEQVGSYQELTTHPKNPFIKKLLTPFSA